MTKTLRKIALMHKLYGLSQGSQCKTCSYLRRESAGRRTVFKCRLYGTSSSEATDWAGKWEACGAYTNAPLPNPPQETMMRLVSRMKDEPLDAPLDGQIDLFERGNAE